MSVSVSLKFEVRVSTEMDIGRRVVDGAKRRCRAQGSCGRDAVL